MVASSGLSAEIYDSIEDADSRQWNHVVEQSEQGSVYHRHEWIRSVEEGIHERGKHVVVTKDGNPVGIFPNFLSSVRLPGKVERRLPNQATEQLLELASVTPGFGGPVIQTDEEQVLELCLSELKKICGGTVISHLVRCPSTSYVRYADYFNRNGYSSSVLRCRFRIGLNGSLEDIRSSMHKDRRYSIRKAKENNSEVYIEEVSERALREFYDGYERTMERVDSEPYPFAFFERLADYLSESLLLVAAEVDGDVVGRHLYVVDDHQEQLHHEFSAVKEDNFQYYPSELIHEFTINWALKRNFSKYDFGPTPSDFEDGLFSYKSQYGGEVVPILVWERGTSPFWTLYETMRGIYRRTT